MNAVLDRLQRKLEWWVIEPQTAWTSRCCGLTSQVFDTTPLRDAVASARKQVFVEEGYKAEDEVDLLDPLAWHLVARERRTQQVAGGLRLVFVDRSRVSLTAADVLELSHVGFASEGEEAVHRYAIELLLEKPIGQFFFFLGGLFVAPSHRRTGLAAVLILAANAMVRTIGCRMGVSFGTTRNGAAEWFTRFGAYDLETDGAALPPFYCTRHRAGTRTLGLDHTRVEPQFDEVVGMFARALQAQRVERKLRQCHYRGAASMLHLGMDGTEHDPGVASTETQRAEFSLRKRRETPVAAHADVLWRDCEVESSSVTC